MEHVTRFAATDDPEPPLEVPGLRFCIVRVAEGPAEGTSRVRRSHFSEVGLGQDDRARFPQALDEGRIARRTIIRVSGVHAPSRAHVEGVVLILDGEHHAVEDADELARGCKVGVLLRRHFQCIGHRRIVIHRGGHAPCFSTIEPQPFSFGWSQIQGHQGIELMRILDGCDRSLPEDPVWLINACAVIRPDTVQVDLHHPRRCQFASQDRRLNILNRRFLDPEFCSLRRGQRWRE
jgi:hypothetical protein